MAGLLDDYMAQVQDYKKAGSIGVGLLSDRPNLELGKQGLLSQMQSAEAEYLKRVSNPLPYYRQNPEAQGLGTVTPIVDLMDLVTGGGKAAMAGFVKNAANKAKGLMNSFGDAPLSGAPMPANIPQRGLLNIGPNPDAEAAAIDYAKQSGIPYSPINQLNPVDAEFGALAAREYELMRHDPTNPFVADSYAQMKKELIGQYDAMLKQGIRPEFDTNPYPTSPYESLIDLIENKRLKVFPTNAGYGSAEQAIDISQNPLLEISPYKISGQPATYNDLFRAVHDFQGHSKSGAGFRAAGEDNAYLSHAGTMRGPARRALASETRGQNSLLNFGPDGDKNRSAVIEDTIFADQKVGNLPNYITEKGTPELYARQKRFDQLRSSDNTGLEGAVDDAGNLRLVHYSPRPIERVDPDRYGKGLSGRTISERNRSANPDFVNRSFYGIEATANPYRKEFGLGSNKVETQIDAAQVYDAQKDPDGLWKAAKGDVTKGERNIYDAGYSGYHVNNKQLGKVAAIFDPLDITKKLMIPLGTIGTAAFVGDKVMEENKKGLLDIGPI